MTQPRTEEWDRDALSRLIHDKTWNGEFWGRDGAIQLALKQFNQLVNWRTDSQARAAAHSSLSSTYYSAAGNAAGRFKTAPWYSKPLWAVRALKCRSQALRNSDEVERLTLGLKGMTPDQLDVRATILRKAGRYDHALRCIEEALSRPNLRDESRALLLVGKGEILDQRGEYNIHLFNEARDLASRVRPQTQVRIHRARGGHLERIGHPDYAADDYVAALQLAHEIGGMKDQILKIETRLREIGYGFRIPEQRSRA